MPDKTLGQRLVDILYCAFMGAVVYILFRQLFG